MLQLIILLLLKPAAAAALLMTGKDWHSLIEIKENPRQEEKRKTLIKSRRRTHKR